VGPLQPTGPGRFVIAGQEWWVLWADGDYRTLVIGTPSGRFGFVLNRAGGISADRMRAAREILEWNGYDLAQFRAL
jgi:apolipoprotein D and lipocalin family protein